MVKFSSGNLLEILRSFDIANETHSPRAIEYVKVLQPSESSQLFTFRFGKTTYGVFVDPSPEDDRSFIESAVRQVLPDVDGQLVELPQAGLTTYGLPYKGKDVYLWREASSKERLDTYLASERPEHSRSTWQKYIKNGDVQVNGTVVTKPRTEIEPHDTVTVHTAPVKLSQTVELPIIFENAHVIAIDKPVGVLTHAKGAIAEEFTVADFFRQHTTVGLATNRPGVVHRLDRDTSGVLLGARTDEATQLLKKQFADRTVRKTYYAVLASIPKQSAATVDLPIGRTPSAPSTFRVDASGKSAQTTYEVLAVNDSGEALVRLTPKTGRTHQLRVHMSYIGCPIVGDRVYGTTADRLYLHARSLEITLPGGTRHTFEAPLPAEFLARFPGVKVSA